MFTSTSNKMAFLLALTCGFSGTSALAGGSLPTSKVLSEITNKPLRQTIIGNFTLAPVALGERIGSRVAPKLGGRRVGPYQICAKPLGATGGYSLLLNAHTDTRFKNTQGKEVEIGPDAVSIEEEVTAIEITPVEDYCNSNSDQIN